MEIILGQLITFVQKRAGTSLSSRILVWTVIGLSLILCGLATYMAIHNNMAAY